MKNDYFKKQPNDKVHNTVIQKEHIFRSFFSHIQFI